MQQPYACCCCACAAAQTWGAGLGGLHGLLLQENGWKVAAAVADPQHACRSHVGVCQGWQLLLVCWEEADSLVDLLWRDGSEWQQNKGTV